jgi:hypothetical protein
VSIAGEDFRSITISEAVSLTADAFVSTCTGGGEISFMFIYFCVYVYKSFFICIHMNIFLYTGVYLCTIIYTHIYS